VTSSRPSPTPNPNRDVRFRRRRKFQGASWTPENSAAEIGDGAWCKHCRTRHGYKNGLNINYSKNDRGEWVILWSCKKTDMVVEETVLRRSDDGGEQGSATVEAGK
jgi:hypothetical protein